MKYIVLCLLVLISISQTVFAREYKPCSKKRGLCVPEASCDIVNFTFKEVRFKKKCKIGGHVCCAHKAIMGELGKEKFNKIDKKILTTKKQQPPICGIRNLKGIGQQNIKSDKYSKYGEFPWMVSVLEIIPIVYPDSIKRNIHKYICGGVLIHPKVIATSASCVIENLFKGLIVGAGVWDPTTFGKQNPNQHMKVDKIVTHPLFLNDTKRYDIALLILENPFELTETIQSICLPKPYKNIASKDCVVSSWHDREIMRKLELSTISRKKCEQLIQKNVMKDDSFKLGSTFICTDGEPNKYTCIHDGGHPLICPIKGSNPTQYQLVGILSWMKTNCNQKEIPTVFTNVAVVVNWIYEKLVVNGIYSLDEINIFDF